MISGHSFESLNEYVSHLPPPVAPPPTVGVDAEPKRATAINLCDAWRMARPIAIFLFALPFIPAKWRGYLDLIVESLDMSCPPLPIPGPAPNPIP